MAKRQYNNEYPSVTTILGVLRKIGLENWFKYNTPQFIKEESEKGKLIGTQIHEAIQNHIELNDITVETAYPDEVMNALKGFLLFKKENPDFKFILAEKQLTSEKHKYNGTLDCLAEKTGLPVIMDWKSSTAKKKDRPDIYDEYLYQVAAYVMAYNEQEKANIKDAFILAFAKDKIAYTFYQMPATQIEDCFNEVFLPVLKIFNYQRSVKNGI